MLDIEKSLGEKAADSVLVSMYHLQNIQEELQEKLDKRLSISTRWG